MVMMMENQATASSIGVDDNCNIQKGHCTALLQHAEPSEGSKFWVWSGGANSNSSLLKEKALFQLMAK